MSFHSAITSAAGWPADLVAAGVVGSTVQVYSGRRAQDKARRDLEVWLERLPDTPGGSGGAGTQLVTGHPYRVHVRRASNLGPARTGDAQLGVVEAHLATIRARYHGRHFPAAIVAAVPALANVIHAAAEEEAIDADPEDEGVLEGTVRVTWYEKE